MNTQQDISDFSHLFRRIRKNRNIFLSKRRLVLGDLGHAKSINAQGSSKKSKSRLDSFGTDGYIAPEIITEEYKYSEKIDIWLDFYNTLKFSNFPKSSY